MRHLTLSGPQRLTWAEADSPTLSSPTGALVRPVAAATCDFDHLVVAGAMRAALPVPLGHEGVAEVLAIGAEVTSVTAGDLVVVPFQISCGRCLPCRRGATAACRAVAWLSCYGLGAMSGDWGGMVSDVVAVPYADAMLVPLPAGVDPAAAAATGCNVVDAYRCVGPQLTAVPGARVLVLSGAFPSIALYATQIAVALGADSVVFHDPDPVVAVKAETLGADVAGDAGRLGRRAFDVVVDASMDRDLLTAGLHAVDRGGFVTISTMYVGRPVALALSELFETGATLQSGQPHARALVEPVLDLVARGLVDLAAVTDSVSPWEDAPRAFAHGKGKHVVVR